MPASDFWALWFRDRFIEPLPDHRLDMAAALIAQTVANFNRVGTSEPYSLDDFLFKWNEKEPEPPSAEQLAEKMLAIQRIQNALIENKPS